MSDRIPDLTKALTKVLETGNGLYYRREHMEVGELHPLFGLSLMYSKYLKRYQVTLLYDKYDRIVVSMTDDLATCKKSFKLWKKRLSSGELPKQVRNYDTMEKYKYKMVKIPVG